MSIKSYRTNGKIPNNLYELSHVTGDGVNLSVIFCPSSTLVGLDIARKPWFSFLNNNDLLWKHIANMYKYKPFTDDITNRYKAPFDYSDFADLESIITIKSCATYWKNMYKYDKLWEALTVEFNPLWNVDGTETTTRTLEKDGTISNARDGYDELVNSGHDDTTKSGKDYNIKSGSENTRRLGDDDTTYSGKEETKRNGDRTLKTEGGEISTHEEATTDSQSFITTTKDNTFYGVEGEQGELGSAKRETETYTNLKDEKTFTDREDSIHHDVTDTTTYNNVRDEMNFDSGVETEYHSTHRTTHDVDDVQTFDTIDTERTTYERHGNIGVTTTTQLLTEYVEYAKLVDFVDIVARDILETITMGVY